jgi:hypothetical protein
MTAANTIEEIRIGQDVIRCLVDAHATAGTATVFEAGTGFAGSSVTKGLVGLIMEATGKSSLICFHIKREQRPARLLVACALPHRRERADATPMTPLTRGRA